MALLPHLDSRRGRVGLLGAAVVAGAFGVLVAVLRTDYFAAGLIGVVVAVLVLAFVWTEREPHDDERQPLE